MYQSCPKRSGTEIVIKIIASLTRRRNDTREADVSVPWKMYARFVKRLGNIATIEHFEKFECNYVNNRKERYHAVSLKIV